MILPAMRPRTAAYAIVLSTALATVSLRALWPEFRTVIPGAAGDNLAFLWNTWWAAHAWRQFPAVLRTPLLFAPWGTSLVLHTHTLLPSTVAAAIPGAIAGTNVIIAAHLMLNALCAYALAFRVTRAALPSTTAAIVFGWSPYIGVHLAGHFNLIAAWVLPLFVLLLLRTLDDEPAHGGIACGTTFAAIAYVDYYYFIYAAALAAVILARRAVRVSRVRTRLAVWQRAAIMVCAALLLIDLVMLVSIGLTGGGSISVAGARISLRGVENPSAMAGFLIMLALAAAYLPRIRIGIDRPVLAADAAKIALAIGVAAVLLAPLAFAATALSRHGGYVSQTYFWRSAPAGIDVGTLLLGNPASALYGRMATHIYERLHIDAIEHAAWLGPAVVALAAAALIFGRGDRRVGVWTTIGVVFGLWALGPRLLAFGRDLHVFLPGVLVRYVPLAANARMPGRAMIMVYLAAAMLAALGAEMLLARGRRAIVWGLVTVVVLDFLPQQPAFFRPDRPAVYDTLARSAGPGAVCELPMGLRDGFGETGRLDMRVLYYQTLHGRPITGGFVARLDPRVLAAYQFDPVLGVLLRLSGGATLASQQTLSAALAGESLRAQGIRFVVLNRREATPDLMRFVDSGLPLRIVQEDEERTLYELTAPVNASLESPFR